MAWCGRMTSKYLTAFREKRARIEQERREREREAERARLQLAQTADHDQDATDDEAADLSINRTMADGDNVYDVTISGADPSGGHSNLGDDTEETGNDDRSPTFRTMPETIDLEELKESVDSGESHPLHLPMALNGELSYQLTNALRAELAMNPEIAIRVLAFTFALSILSGTYVASCPISDLKISKPHVPKDLQGTEAAASSPPSSKPSAPAFRPKPMNSGLSSSRSIGRCSIRSSPSVLRKR